MMSLSVITHSLLIPSADRKTLNWVSGNGFVNISAIISFVVILINCISRCDALQYQLKALEVTDYRNQVGGHLTVDGTPAFRKCDSTILKTVANNERGRREASFYEYLRLRFESGVADDIDTTLMSFQPKFFNLVQYHDPTTGKLINATQQEDLLHNFQIPCTMDIKLGKKTARSDKPKGRVAKAWKSRDILKMGLSDMNVFNRTDNSWIKYTKSEVREADFEEYVGIFATFFRAIETPSDKLRVLQYAEERLESMKTWFKVQKRYRFPGASIFLAYDAQNPDAVRLHIIDFARMEFHEGTDFNTIDQNSLDGVNTILRLVRLIRNKIVESKYG